MQVMFIRNNTDLRHLTPHHHQEVITGYLSVLGLHAIYIYDVFSLLKTILLSDLLASSVSFPTFMKTGGYSPLIG